MRFKLILTSKDGNDIEAACVVFNAPTWSAAAEWALVFARQIGCDVDGFRSEITLAPGKPSK